MPCKSSRLCITLTTFAINLIGGILNFLYLLYIGLLFHESDFRLVEQLFFAGVVVLAIAGEIGHGMVLGAVYKTYNRLQKNAETPVSRFVKFRAVNLPAIVSFGSFTLWIFAAIVFGGIVWYQASNQASLNLFAQIFISVGVLAGGTTSILIYFIVERFWQPFIPAFFPDGDMSGVPSLRPSIFQRLFVLFTLGIMPLIVMAGATYNAASQGLPVPELLKDLREISLFVLGSSFFVALFLAFSVGFSLVNFSKDLLTAMRKVAQGDLETSLDVTTEDELGKLASGFNAMLTGLRQEELVRRLFERYVGSEVATHLIQEKESIAPELVDATIYFVDIRKFTNLTESLPPEELMRVLSRFLSEMSVCVEQNNGLINKFIGDSIMAIFGTNLNETLDPAMDALNTANCMLANLRALNSIHEREGVPALKIGIGIASGKILAGTLGEGERVEYTFIGDAVNLASRLESMTKEVDFPLLLDSVTANLLPADKVRHVGAVTIRGKEQPVTVYTAAALAKENVPLIFDALSPLNFPQLALGKNIFNRYKKNL